MAKTTNISKSTYQCGEYVPLRKTDRSNSMTTLHCEVVQDMPGLI